METGLVFIVVFDCIGGIFGMGAGANFCGYNGIEAFKDIVYGRRS